MTHGDSRVPRQSVSVVPAFFALIINCCLQQRGNKLVTVLTVFIMAQSFALPDPQATTSRCFDQTSATQPLVALSRHKAVPPDPEKRGIPE